MHSNQVLLGIKDTVITTNDNTYCKTNKIGGEPDLMSNTSVACTPRCQLCDRKMALAIQVYCPLGTSTYDRTLYVFCCINQTCWNKQESWQVYRTQQISREHVIKDEMVSLKEDSWLSEESNWDEDSDSDITNSDISCNKVINDLCVAAEKECNIEAPCITEECNHEEAPDVESSCFIKECNPLTTKLLEMNRATSHTLPWQPLQMPLVPPDYSPVFKSYFINVIEEPPKEKNPDKHVLRLLFNYAGTVNREAGSAPPENYENVCANDENWMFQKFVNRVSRCQEQVIRYQWNGEPLLMTEETLPLICHYCHGPTVYELQLMPALVGFLKLESIENEDAAVEFGTVLIFTCQNSCWEEGAEYKKEMICVQSDPDEHLFQQRI